jgi:hypothetical protein
MYTSAQVARTLSSTEATVAVTIGFQFELARWKDWAPEAVGVAFGLGVFMWIWFTYARRPARPPKAAPSDLAPETSLKLSLTPDKRGAARRRGSLVAVLVTDITGKAAPCRSLVLDRSVGGVRLEMNEPVEPGTILNLRPAEAAEKLPWVAVEVRYCQSVDGSWHTGCQFLRTPPSNVLWHFG